MIIAGIDVGAKTTKVVVLKDGAGVQPPSIVGRGLVVTEFDQEATAREALEEALRQAGLTWGDLDRIVATGAGRKAIPFAHADVTDVGADARGAAFLHPAVHTVIDVGAEEGRGIRCNQAGRVMDFAVNEKCAAGAGSFTESMARALEISLEEMGPLSLQAQNPVPMNAQCVIFAESEVVSLIHARTPKADIVRSVHDAITSRIISMVRRVGVEPDVMLTGGVAHNVGFVDSLRRGLEVELVVPDYPEFVGALGAALVGREQA